MLRDRFSQLHPFYVHSFDSLDIEDLFEVTEGMANIVNSQPIDRIDEAMKSLSEPILQRLSNYLARSNNPDAELYKQASGVFYVN